MLAEFNGYTMDTSAKVAESRSESPPQGHTGI